MAKNTTTTFIRNYFLYIAMFVSYILDIIDVHVSRYFIANNSSDVSVNFEEFF